jgi:hypothetical protein
MTTEQPQKIWSGIDIVKIGAGGLAAVSAAVAASSLGVAGTLAGAAIASVVGTVGTELYANSLKRGYGRLRRAKPDLVDVPRTGDAVPIPSATDPDATTVFPAVTVASAQAAAGAGPATYGSVAERRPRWKHVVLIAVAIFVFAMTAIFLVELMAKQSLAAVFGHDTGGSTTISSVVGGGGGNDDPAPAVSPTTGDDTEVTPSVTPEPDATPTADETTAPDDPGTTTGAPTETEPPVPTIPQTVAPTGDAGGAPTTRP